MKISVAQINTTIGDLQGNAKKMIEKISGAKHHGFDLIIFPELALTGYPPEDFILLPHFMEAVAFYLDQIAEASKEIAVILGLPRYNPYRREKGFLNSAAWIQNQKIMDFADKILLPTYDVFDERRYFEPGLEPKVWDIHQYRVGITICEDIWQHSGLLESTLYKQDPLQQLKEKHPTLVINISASPYSLQKFEKRMQICLHAAQFLECPVILCNQVGGNDSLLFDGNSLYVDSTGLKKRAKSFCEEEMTIDLSQEAPTITVKRNQIEDLYQALVIGVRDYFHKLGFQKGCLGLSGGIDSSVAASIMAEALGPDQVLGIAMPSRYSSPESIRDATLLANRLGIDLQEIPIEPIFDSYLSSLLPFFRGKETDVTEENLQSRIRGTILMAFANKMGYIVVSTGNKSELALGYTTLYGDLCGGLALLGDVTKQQVYALADWINRNREIIPLYAIQRAPSAELRPNQKDSDSLPDYSIIDQIVAAYIEGHRSPQWIAKKYDYPLGLVNELIERIHNNEFKRRQAPPVLRVSEKSFSIGRRFPIVQKWV